MAQSSTCSTVARGEPAASAPAATEGSLRSQYTGGKRAAIDDYAAARRAGQDTAAPLFADDDTRATDALVAKSTRHSVYNYHSRFVGGQSRACFSTLFFTPDGLRWIDGLLLEVPDGWRVGSLSEERDCECKPKTNQPCAMVP